MEDHDKCDGLSADGEYVLVHKDGTRWDDDRYSTRESAEMAVDAWYDRVKRANPGTKIIWHLIDTPSVAQIENDGSLTVIVLFSYIDWPGHGQS